MSTITYVPMQLLYSDSNITVSENGTGEIIIRRSFTEDGESIRISPMYLGDIRITVQNADMVVTTRNGIPAISVRGKGK